jgi:hypothetical protein
MMPGVSDRPDPDELPDLEALREALPSWLSTRDKLLAEARDPARKVFGIDDPLDLLHYMIGDYLQRYATVLRREPSTAQQVAEALDVVADLLKRGDPPWE